MLREKIGNNNFKKGIQTYYKKYFNANTTTANFIAEMEKASNQNLKPFFAQYLTRPDNLKLTGSWTYDDNTKQITVKLQQTQSSGQPFDFPIEIAVYKPDAASAEIQKFTMNTLQSEFKIPSATKPSSIVLDPRVVLLSEFDFK
jgi:aminopeptidase N